MHLPVKLFACLLAPIRAWWGLVEGEGLRSPGRTVWDHQTGTWTSQSAPVGIKPTMLGLTGPTWPTRLWPTCSGGLLHCYYHSGPKADWGELPTCKCAHEQPYCHLIVSERGLGMHLPVTSTSRSAILLAQGEERVGDRLGMDRSLGRESWERGLERVSILAWALVWPRVGSEELTCM